MSILYESKQEFHIPHSTFNIEFFAPQKTLGGYCGGVPPLPIPNREVKPACADGTAMQCGRVGSRPFSRRALVTTVTEALFVGICAIFGQ